MFGLAYVHFDISLSSASESILSIDNLRHHPNNKFMIEEYEEGFFFTFFQRFFKDVKRRKNHECEQEEEEN